MKTPFPTRAPKPSEEGYILVAVMFMLAILVIAMAVAAPKIAKSIQRDREVETMHRGKQYARAVKLYYKQFGAYPPNVDALVKTNEIRFLRRKYIDPTTGKDEWKPVRLGQNKAPTAMGFFGVPLGGMGGGGLCGSGLTGSSTSPGGSSSMFSSGTSGGGGGSSSTTSGCPSDGSGSNAVGSTSTTDANGANGTNGTSGASDSNTSNGTATGGTGVGGSTGTSGIGTGTGLTGQTFGGAGIIGFSPNSPKQSILVYKKKNHYNEWEFVYDPIAEQMMMQGGNAGAGLGQQGSPGNSSNPTSPTTIPGGNNPGFPGSPTGPTTNAPQQ